MLRRATDLVGRARERIRLAAEHDPHAWPERDDDRAILVRDDEPEPFDPVYGGEDDGPATDDTPRDADGATRPPLGSPAAAAPDLDGPLGPGGVSGPPRGGRPHRPAERSRPLMGGAGTDRPEQNVPNGLRT